MTLRTRLMLLYSVPFFVVGSILVTVPLLGVQQSAPVGSVPAPHPVPEVTQFPIGTWAVTMLGLIVASVALGWVVSGRYLHPLRKMTETAREISATNLHRRLSDSSRARDELGELAATLDQLFGRLEASFASQRQFVANASHELRTPLTAEKALLQVALADPDASAESLREACSQVLLLNDAQERLIGALLTLANGQQGVERPTEMDLADITEVALRARPTDRVSVKTTLAPTLIWGDTRLVESLVVNLVDNALRHNVAGGHVEVITESVRDDSGGRITVRNTGPVVPPAELDRLFEPFQRLARPRIGHGDGYGLGLAIVRAIANVHGAGLDAHTRPEGGLDIAITFPPGTPFHGIDEPSRVDHSSRWSHGR
ncbi:sensor histidine kinase [Actinoplanes regularis]|uniref:sensor histidine kinase n=1 Tax=Actinoplanes regularis TaxID=52697 RepID=UPI0024A34FB8|nr:ATP-binding protein [Actinoplanes regularis]GLW31195.1 two-component sensor histidine kinase [Actinoplanes regularis]